MVEVKDEVEMMAREVEVMDEVEKTAQTSAVARLGQRKWLR
jgi:hypothetical protein